MQTRGGRGALEESTPASRTPSYKVQNETLRELI